MASRTIILVFALVTLASLSKAEYVVQSAVAYIQSEVVSGNVTFTLQEDGSVRVTGAIEGLPSGLYGFHIHELGDPTDSCVASGAHYNPGELTHGGPEHEIRHVGDLGNLAFDVDNISRIDITDSLIDLNGASSIIGRTLVLHEQEDDLGLGGHETSLTTGNAGARIGCGVIGIAAESWTNAANSMTGPFGWCVVTLMCLVTKYV